jgi:hypothetical protein
MSLARSSMKLPSVSMYTASACASTTVSTVGRADWETQEHHGCGLRGWCHWTPPAGRRKERGGGRRLPAGCQAGSSRCLRSDADRPAERSSPQRPRHFPRAKYNRQKRHAARGVTHSPGAPQNSVTSPTATPPPSMVSMSEQKVMTCLTTSCAFSRNNAGRGRPVRQPRAATK